MREPRNDPKRLEDILKAIDAIFLYMGGRDKNAFLTDTMAYHAVIYNIMIIGEAANMLTHEFREAHPNLNWRQITNMRNFLIHGYHNVEQDLVWEAIFTDLPVIRAQITHYLEELQNHNR